MDLTIRPSTPADIPAIARLTFQTPLTYRDFAGPDWRAIDPLADEDQIRNGFETAPGVWSLVAERDGEVVGHVALTQARTFGEPRVPIPREGNLWRLFVVPEHWGTGLASDLLQRAHAELRARRYTGCRLYTPKAHARARRFYEREGWRATGHEEYSESLGLDLVEYRLELDQT